MARKRPIKGTEKHLNSQCKQCTREQEPNVEWVPVGVCRNTSAVARVKKERIVQERNSGPRPEARKEEQGKIQVGKGDTRVCWSCGKTGHIVANCTKGSWNRSLNAVDEDKGDTSEEVRRRRLAACVVFAEGERE